MEPYSIQSQKDINGNYFQPVNALIQFCHLLTERNYNKAAECARISLKFDSYDYLVPRLIPIVIAHFEKTSDPVAELVEILVTNDKNTYGLNVEWGISASPTLFSTALNSYIAHRGLSPEQLEEELKHQLTGFVSYSRFSVAHAKIVIAKLTNFDPRQPQRPSAQTCLESAKGIGRNQEMIEFLESLSPEPKIDLLEVETYEFSGIAELQIAFHEITPEDGEFLSLNTAQKIYEFIGKNPIAEGDQEYFNREVKYFVKGNCSQKDAVELVQKKFQKSIEEYEALKSLLNQGKIEISCTRNLSLNTTHSDGHKNVGVIQLDNGPAVCKFIRDIYAEFTVGCFDTILAISKFVLKCRELGNNVPNVVNIFPHIILNRKSSGDIQVGYLMKQETGEQLRKFKQLSKDEKEAIQTQFETSVWAMLESGYVLYDFNDDNVLWDGKKLTFIDLNEAGFKKEALQYADTDAVIWRMSEMLEKK